MSDDRRAEELARALLESLRADEGLPVPTGSVRRLVRSAGTALGAGLGMLGGRFRGRERKGLGSLAPEQIANMVTALGGLKGLAMKGGQMLGYLDPTLPDEIRSLLALLQTQSQPTSLKTVREIIQAELGSRAAPLIRDLDRKPASVASIGQVHRGRLPDGTPVAVKVLHPGVEQAIRADFRSARIGPAVAGLFAAGGAATVRDFLLEARERMLEECDFALEAERQRLFAKLLAGHPALVVPAVHSDWSTAKVLTTTWEPGLGLEEFLSGHPAQAERDAFGQLLFAFYFGTLYQSGWFHADPHPGNYAFRPDGKLVLYDFGCARRFDRQTVSGFVELARAVVSDDRAGVEQALQAIGAFPPSQQKDYDVLRSLLRGFYGPLLTSGVQPVDARVSGEAKDILRSKMALLRLKLPGKFFFLLRIRFGLYAVLARLGAACDWQALEMELADAFRRQA